MRRVDGWIQPREVAAPLLGERIGLARAPGAEELVGGVPDLEEEVLDGICEAAGAVAAHACVAALHRVEYRSKVCYVPFD